MTKQEKAQQVLFFLQKRYPGFETHLVANSPWELLIATILSAQCTDIRVNQVTPKLFACWPNAYVLSKAEEGDVADVIKSTSFYKTKAKHIIQTAQYVTKNFGGEVPNTIKDLILLPGVARKTANVVLWGGYGINEGIAVDTHVKRITYRIGLTGSLDPKKVEVDLMGLFPQKEWGGLNHRLVWFGRHVCPAKKPRCSECEMSYFCSYNCSNEKKN